MQLENLNPDDFPSRDQFNKQYGIPETIQLPCPWCDFPDSADYDCHGKCKCICHRGE